MEKIKNEQKNKKQKTIKNFIERFFASQIAKTGISQTKNCKDKTR